MTTEITTGQVAPDFSLPKDGGGSYSLADFAGKWLVLYFYPKDDTSGCTTQAIGFSEHEADFMSKGAVVVGVSPDSVAKHDKFKTKHNLTVALLADEEKTTLEAYGVWKEKSMYGKKYMGVERSTFLINPQGKVENIWRKVKVPGHVQEVLASLPTS
jgi:peroxiredoxin Q/BCP